MNRATFNTLRSQTEDDATFDRLCVLERQTRELRTAEGERRASLLKLMGRTGWGVGCDQERLLRMTTKTGDQPPTYWPNIWQVPMYTPAPPQGCICPPTSEKTCENPMCPRKGIKISAGTIPERKGY